MSSACQLAPKNGVNDAVLNPSLEPRHGLPPKSPPRSPAYMPKYLQSNFGSSKKFVFGLRHCPQAGSQNPTFVLQHFVFCIIMCYILLSTALRPQAGFRYFILSHLQKAELKFGGMNSNGRTNELSSSFLFSRKYLSFLYLVPTYHKYLGSTYEKPLFEMKIGQFQGGYDFCISAQIRD